ncbi:S41 family peptidase [Bdellovibrio svalbardensis]|uniref:S41 family peptidase n=1 Tax=Bdellovibrio svalbardensis TaxID=2972972 RepID=A0ABT6DEK4_9BACT|nr:S41 family peptidase [Bdellovibrio svalbardensis]MDG0815247.1 S41 family peptidase [Bdellovibrio svalbardensis]
MLRSPRLTIISLLIFTMGISLSLSRVKSDSSKVKSVDAYWAESGLGPAALEDLLQDNICGSSERYFLACASSILNIANRFNMTLTTEGKLVPVDVNMSADMSSEKMQLESWKQFFNNNTAAAMKLSFLNVWKLLKTKYISEKQESMMVGLGLNGFISVFRDPHTYLIPVAMFKEVVSKADNQTTSLGITLGRANGQYVVRKVMEGSPAKLQGVEKGDVLVEINGQKVRGLMQGRVSELLKGDVGATSVISVLRNGEKKKFKMVRVEITVATVSTRVIDGIKPIGVIGINKFAKGVCEKTKEAIGMVKKADVRGLLLDLRDNPGGQMEEAACVASLFVGADKKIFELRYLDPGKKSEQYYGGEEKIFDRPVAVLMNAGSASAAEIVAGALRDLNRAVLVGERTFGKGSFQEGELWTQNKQIALFETKGFYYLPSGRSPQMKGLSPDVAVNFDKIAVGREEDQFMNPLRAPERQVKALAASISTKDCLEMEDAHFSEDIQLTKARQVLFCTKTVGKTVAGVN